MHELCEAFSFLCRNGAITAQDSLPSARFNFAAKEMETSFFMRGKKMTEENKEKYKGLALVAGISFLVTGAFIAFNMDTKAKAIGAKLHKKGRK